MDHPDRDVLDTVLRFGRLGVTALVLALVVGDAALVTAALQRTHRADPSTVAATDAAASLPSATPSTSPSAVTSTIAPTKQPGAHVVAVSDGKHALFTAATATTAWRAHGGCTGVPNLSRTTDGARTWSAFTAPAPHLLRIEITGAQSGWVVAQQALRLADVLRNRRRRHDLAAHRRSATSGSRCGPASGRRPALRHPPAATPSHRAVSHRRARRRPRHLPDRCPAHADAGATWKPVGRLVVGQSVAAALDGHGTGVLVLTGAPKCGGLRVLTTANVRATWKTGTCLTDAIEPASVAIGPGGAGLLVSAGRAYGTTDSGLHWS